MTISYGFFDDADLTVPHAGALAFTQNADGAGGAQSLRVYFGSPTAGRKARAYSSPGVAAIQLSVADSSAPATALETTMVKLATSEGGLAGATAGAALDLGTVLLSGSANAVPVWIRVQTPALAVNTYTDLQIQTNALIEEPV